MKGYKRFHLVVLLIVALFITQIAAKGSAEAFLIPKPVKSYEEKKIPSKQKLLQVLQAKTSENLLYMWYDDFDRNGTYEAFAFTGISHLEGEETMEGNLWFVTKKTATVLEEDLYCYASTRTLEAGRKIFFVLDEVFAASTESRVYGVKGEKASLFLRGGLIWKDNGAFFIEQDAYDAFEGLDGIKTGHTWKPYWLYYQNGFREFGAIEITKKQLFRFDGAEKIWKNLHQKNTILNTEILYRKNHLIHINYTCEVGDGVEYKNVTLYYDSNSVELYASNEGTYAKAYCPEIATYPLFFPPYVVR